MFTRFVRLGVPTIQLDGQGRARPSLCQLYKWRYKNLGDLPHVKEWPEYCVANPGLRFDYQLIDIGDFNGVGESEPTPHFYQVHLVYLCFTRAQREIERESHSSDYCVVYFMFLSEHHLLTVHVLRILERQSLLLVCICTCAYKGTLQRRLPSLPLTMGRSTLSATS